MHVVHGHTIKRCLQSQLIGTPSPDEIEKIQRKDIRKVLKAMPTVPAKNLTKFYSKAPAPAIEILKETLKFDHMRRSVVMVPVETQWDGAHEKQIC